MAERRPRNAASSSACPADSSQRHSRRRLCRRCRGHLPTTLFADDACTCQVRHAARKGTQAPRPLEQYSLPGPPRVASLLDSPCPGTSPALSSRSFSLTGTDLSPASSTPLALDPNPRRHSFHHASNIFPWQDQKTFLDRAASLPGQQCLPHIYNPTVPALAPADGMPLEPISDLEHMFALATDSESMWMHHDQTNWSLVAPPASAVPFDSPTATVDSCMDVSSRFVGQTQDWQLLHGQGCFQLPSTDALRELLAVYLDHVHAHLPILTERLVYSVFASGDFELGHLSLLLLQTILFTAVGFAPSELVGRYGFKDLHDAQNVLYRRCKLMFDFSLESDAIALSQAALLLTFHAPQNNRRTNVHWLMQAIHFAQLARADKFYEQDSPSARKLLKRLWWGCLLRDRVLSLGMRRAPLIDLDADFARLPADEKYLGPHDLADDASGILPPTDNPDRRLHTIVEHMCRLADTLTPVLRMLYYSSTDTAPRRIPQTLADLKNNLARLHDWHDQAIRALPSPISLYDAGESITAAGNLLFLYFDAAILALGTHALLVCETAPRPQALEMARSMPLSPANEIMCAMTDTTDRVKELVQTGAARSLPISAAAVLMLPLVLQALNVSAARGTDSEGIERRQMDICASAMRSVRRVHDGSDFCWAVVEHVMDGGLDGALAAHVSSRQSSGGSSSKETPSAWRYTTATARDKVTTGWEDLLLWQPRLFVRLSLHVEIALRVGRTPREADFPAMLRRTRGPE